MPTTENQRRRSVDQGLPVEVDEAEADGGVGAEHDRWEGCGGVVEEPSGREVGADGVVEQPGSVAWTLIPLVSPAATCSLRRTVAETRGDAAGLSTGPMRRDHRRASPASADGSPSERRSGAHLEQVGAERVELGEELGPARRRRCPSRRPSAAMPMAMPRAVSAARSRRVRSSDAADAEDVGGAEPAASEAAARVAHAAAWLSSTRCGRRAGRHVGAGCAAMCWSWVTSTMVCARRVEPCEQAEDLGPGGGVEVAGGLVGEHERRPADERPGDGHPLALAARQLGGPMVGAGGRDRPRRGRRVARAGRSPRGTPR